MTDVTDLVLSIDTLDQFPYEKVVLWLKEQVRALEAEYIGKPINDKNKSQFLKLATTNFNGFLFGNIYTGGTIKSKHVDWHRQFLPAYIQDINNQQLLAWTETCGEAYVRLYFELDYRSNVRLPSVEERKQHIRMAYDLACECYPDCDSICYVAHCLPKLKKKSSQWQTPKLALGLHIVFPHIYSNPQEIRSLMLTLDARITKKNPFFKDVVDPESCHTHCCSLRPLFALRAERCKGCNPIIAKPVSVVNQQWNEFSAPKNTKEDVDSDEDETPPPCGRSCQNGYQFIVSSSYYEPWFLLHTTVEGTILEEQNTNDDIQTWIHDMSIIRNLDEEWKEASYKPPFDVVSYDSIRARSYHPMFQGEKAKGNYLSHETHPQNYQLLTDLIHWAFPTKYEFVFTSKMEWSPKISTIYVNIMGPKQMITNCLMNDGCHSNNRIFFVVKIKYEYHIQIQCHKKECRENYKLIYQRRGNKTYKELTNVQRSLLNQARKPLSEEWIEKLQSAFGLSGAFLPLHRIHKEDTENVDPGSLLYDNRIGMYVKSESLSQPVTGLIVSQEKEHHEISSQHTKKRKHPVSVLSNDAILSELDKLF